MTTTADRIAALLRPDAPDKKLMGPEVPLIDQLAALWDARAPKPVAEPPWVTFGRSKVGEREIVGPKHNTWIVAAWKRLGAGWFVDDETPWCGNFVAQCMEAAGLPWPKEFARAKAWATYGRPLATAVVGAIGVKSRVGGGHVFIIIGETPDGRSFKVLEGNANNMVRIGDIPKAVVEAIRWPLNVPVLSGKLPVIAAGAIAGSEA